MTEHNDSMSNLTKLLVAWAGAIFGSITLQHIVLFATLVYTLLQCYVLIRDKIVAKGTPRGD